MPGELTGWFCTRRVVLPVQPVAGSSHQGRSCRRYDAGLMFAVMPEGFWAGFHRHVMLKPKLRIIVTTPSSAPQIPSVVAEEVRLC
jgi:hypothetical protein